MRRISFFLAVAAVLVSGIVGYTYKLRLEKEKARRVTAVPAIRPGLKAFGDQGWVYEKDDPHTNKPIVKVHAKSIAVTDDPSTFALKDLALRLYDKDGSSYTYVKSDEALFDEKSGLLKSHAPVYIVMHVPSDKDAEDKNEAAKLVRIHTSAITYETKSGKATTDAPATFDFPQGGGQAVGAEYDPNTHELHLKSQVKLDWLGNGPPENKMHVESGDLVYKEQEQKIYLSPWSTMQRQTTLIRAQKSVVTLQDGILHQIDSDQPVGTDDRDDRHTTYSADKMRALFNDDGVLVNIIGEKDAKVISRQPGSQTTVTGDRADLRFTVDAEQQADGTVKNNSILHLVLADGHAAAKSMPLPDAGAQLPETRILRSEHIELEMKPDGKDVQEIRAPTQAQLEFKPNRPDQAHRTLHASRLRILYGASSYIDTFLAWNVATHTDKPAPSRKAKEPHAGQPAGVPVPALTWSDEMVAKFTPNTNQIATIEQTGNFRYQEGARKAQAKKAFLEQAINRITLTGGARVSDDTGSTIANRIVMNQTSGNMDAMGKVVSTHLPDSHQKPGTSMLDDSEPMLAKADQMQTRDGNSKVFYEGKALIWQGANRISADAIAVDRDEQTLHAAGNVISELVDKSNNDQAKDGNGQNGQSETDAGGVPIFTVVYAPELFYQDDTRVARYSGGAKLVRDKITVTSKQLRAFLTPKNNNNDQSSLDHAIADGDVSITEMVNGRTRTGTSQHCEYYTDNDKVVLNGGIAQLADSVKGTTKARQLTYYSDDDRLIADGIKAQPAFTDMNKKK